MGNRRCLPIWGRAHLCHAALEAARKESTMAGTLLADIPNEVTRAVLIRNLINLTHITGMRMTNDGFFQITNRVSGGTEARLDSGGNWSKASDRRLKRDVQDVSHMLE